jgi:hypothetical protein
MYNTLQSTVRTYPPWEVQVGENMKGRNMGFALPGGSKGGGIILQSEERGNVVSANITLTCD